MKKHIGFIGFNELGAIPLMMAAATGDFEPNLGLSDKIIEFDYIRPIQSIRPHNHKLNVQRKKKRKIVKHSRRQNRK